MSQDKTVSTSASDLALSPQKAASETGSPTQLPESEDGFRSELGAKVYADLCSVVAIGRLADRAPANRRPR